MFKKEKEVLNKLQILASKFGHRLFRNSVGQAWAGRYKARLANGDVVISQASAVKYGLCVGSGDLIGGTKVKITPDMVGQEILVFTNVEIKCSTTKASKEQISFHNYIKSAGGYSFIDRINSDEEFNNSEYVKTISRGLVNEFSEPKRNTKRPTS